MSKAIVIDGNSLVYRTYWATYKMLNYFKENNLTPTNAVNLFTKSVLNLFKNKQYDYAFVAFDHAKQTFRSAMLDKYKANRNPMPDDLRTQLPMIFRILESMGIAFFSKEGYEADDLIGSFCKIMNDTKIDVDVFTSDRDMLQLVNNLTTVNLFKVGVSKVVTYNLSNFSQLYYGLSPKQVIDYKAIVGDGSDNFPGIKGIGPKVATQLLLKYITLDNIYVNLDNLSLKQKQLFVNNKDMAYLCYKIATINNTLFNIGNLDIFRKKAFNKEKFVSLVNEYKIPSLLNKISK